MKIINLYVNVCDDCPYLNYDPHYSMSTASGYDCEHDKGGRIIDDHQWKNGQKIIIPDWCPLPDVGRREKIEKIMNNLKNNKGENKWKIY